MRYDEYSRASSEHPERNEDSFLIFTGDGQSAPVFAVIDGMGGHQHLDEKGQLVTGREAAATIKQVIQETLLDLAPDISANLGEVAETRLLECFERANTALFQGLNRGQNHQESRVGAVATIAILCEEGKRLLIGQVGDTRAYLFSEGELFQLCEDEDNVSHLLQKGAMTDLDAQKIKEILNRFDGIHEPQVSGTIKLFGQDYDLYMAWRWFLTGNAALQIPGGNVVISALGIHAQCPNVQRSRMQVALGDALVMLSDGVYKNLTDAEIQSRLQEAAQAAQALGEAAYNRSLDKFNRRSTSDDITAIYLKFD